MTGHPLRKIVIVGGGSAGWMAAAYLRKALPTEIEITQIESPHVGSIGVGEGTVPIIREFIDFLGLEDSDWIRFCNATFKLGIRFENWLDQNKSWWHPFYFKHPQYPEKQIVNSWLALRQQGCEQFHNTETLQQGCMSWQLARDNRCPAFLASCGSFEQWDSDHAFHFDAALFGRYLKERVAIPGGVHSIVDHVTGVDVNEGRIVAVQTENSGRIAGDFFLDCTGFKRVLINEVGASDFVSYQNELLCDRAVTIAVPYVDKVREMRSYTVATALSSGWVWQISLFHRIGAGYVYSSRHISDEDAEQELRSFLGEDRVKEVIARRIRFEAGRLNNPLVGNCVATGLSEGFVEPLEATALGVTQKHIRDLAELLKKGEADLAPDEIEKYNRSSRKLYDEIKEFLVSHYCFTRRRDTRFWCDVSKLRSPLHKVHETGLATIPREMIGAGVFSPESWICLAAGFDCLPIGNAGNIPAPVLSLDALVNAQRSQRRVLRGFMHQNFYLNHLHSQSEAQQSQQQ